MSEPIQRGDVLAAATPATSGYFGAAVSLSSNGLVLAIGAARYGVGGGVYIYDWTGSVWVQRGNVLTPADPASTDYFGTGVSLSADGSVLAVGAPRWEGSFADEGGVYIYDWKGGAWVQRGVVLTPDSATSSDYFGTSVSLSADGGILVVGAVNGGVDQGGRVHSFTWTGTSWSLLSGVIAPADIATSDYYGSAVSLSADGLTLAVGAMGWEGTVTEQGGVYIYDWAGGAWVQRGGVLTASDADNYAGLSLRFGASLDLSADGSILAVGAGAFPSWGSPPQLPGFVYIHDRSGSVWVQRGAVLTAADAANQDNFGIGVSMSSDGSVLAVGASRWEGALSDQGGAYVYDISMVIPLFWTNFKGQREAT